MHYAAVHFPRLPVPYRISLACLPSRPPSHSLTLLLTCPPTRPPTLSPACPATATFCSHTRAIFPACSQSVPPAPAAASPHQKKPSQPQIPVRDLYPDTATHPNCVYSYSKSNDSWYYGSLSSDAEISQREERRESETAGSLQALKGQ
jgi:hypothetical protein